MFVLSMLRPVYTFNGHTYTYYDEHMGDNVKREHIVLTPDDKEIYIDFSPYDKMTELDFKRYVMLGYPGRVGAGPLRSKDLEGLEMDALADVYELAAAAEDGVKLF